MSRKNKETHLRIPYLRASFQGGDTQNPLCKKPMLGVCEEFAGWPMTDLAPLVTCKRCLHWMRKGGLPARYMAIRDEYRAPTTALPRKRRWAA